jgi:hypothetical protein
LLSAVDAALAPFLKDMAADEHGKNVVTMVYSEFGRRAAANASDRTDHGSADPVFIAGVPVKGGFYGDEPSLPTWMTAISSPRQISATFSTNYSPRRSGPTQYLASEPADTRSASWLHLPSCQRAHGDRARTIFHVFSRHRLLVETMQLRQPLSTAK